MNKNKLNPDVCSPKTLSDSHPTIHYKYTRQHTQSDIQAVKMILVQPKSEMIFGTL